MIISANDNRIKGGGFNFIEDPTLLIPNVGTTALQEWQLGGAGSPDPTAALGSILIAPGTAFGGTNRWGWYGTWYHDTFLPMYAPRDIDYFDLEFDIQQIDASWPLTLFSVTTTGSPTFYANFHSTGTFDFIDSIPRVSGTFIMGDTIRIRMTPAGFIEVFVNEVTQGSYTNATFAWTTHLPSFAAGRGFSVNNISSLIEFV